MKKFLPVLLIIIVLMISACAAGPNTLSGIPDSTGEVAGFWMGLWHGIASPVVFIISLFRDSVTIYETHNNGNWYNFGFLLGASIIFGGSGSGACKNRKR